MTLPYTLSDRTGPNLGLIVLQADETTEHDMATMLPQARLYTSRVPSAEDVSPQSLHETARHLGTAAHLLPRGMEFATIAYACTSAASHIGPERLHALITDTTPSTHTTDPVRALLAACANLQIKRLGLLTPYVPSVSENLRQTLQSAGITTPAFGTFNEASEATVVRIDTASIIAAGEQIAAQCAIDALFLSCTNLRTLQAIPALEEKLNIPVISSNSALAWHMTRQAGLPGIRMSSRLTAQN